MVQPGLRQVAEIFSQAAVVAEMDARLPLGLHPWEADVVARFFPPAGRVLDLGCGPGREAFALAQRGYEVVGADISAAVLERARAHAVAAGVVVEWVLVDGVMVPPGPFDAITLWAQVLGNIERREDQVALLRNCRAALAPGGVLSASGHFADFCRRQWGDQTDGDWFYPTGSWEPGTLKYHLFTADSLTALLRAAGLEVVASATPASLPAIVQAVARRAP